MSNFVCTVIADSKPNIQTLQRYVIPCVATKWYELGVELFDEGGQHELDTIETDHPKDAKKCCHKMFRLWLTTHTNTTWHEIVKALKSPCVDLAPVAAKLEEKLIGKCNNICRIMLFSLYF